MNAASPHLQKKIIELSNLRYKVYTEITKCIACGTCVRFCPLKLRAFNIQGKPITISLKKSCGGCSVCVKRCPQNAIKLIPFKIEVNS